MIRLILLGGPGSGKGTQADRMKERYKAVKISTGDLLREEIRRESELGRRARQFMDKGELVPDDIMIGILDKITQKFESRKQSYILDGFPRTLPQAEALLEMLKKQEVALSSALLIDVPESELVRRLSSRWTCKNCGATVGYPDGKPRHAVCGQCGGELYQRDDDKKETILNRLKVYRKNTEPLIRYFEEKGLLKRVNGFGDPDSIAAGIAEILEHLPRT
ncbi:MAG: adenylate kinase [Candidatus Marinimicrobia bacterium]|nr:adenylate kinase [Candidatus Neomarinimicrobiota bacterium]MDD4961403.1 adenylate kinase [Candidatus Neomarinimicrobiota bacterium]MDD5709683.1 adenylate kinase [Candidatus Neomarinimicrobiota bacterium]